MENKYEKQVDLPEIKAGAAGAWARAGEVPVRAGAEIYPEAALFHGAEAGTGGRSVKAPEGAEMIHTQTCRPALNAGLSVFHMFLAEFGPIRFI